MKRIVVVSDIQAPLHSPKDGKHVTPTPIPIVGNRFTVEGDTYQWR